MEASALRRSSSSGMAAMVIWWCYSIYAIFAMMYYQYEEMIYCVRWMFLTKRGLSAVCCSMVAVMVSVAKSENISTDFDHSMVLNRGDRPSVVIKYKK